MRNILFKSIFFSGLILICIIFLPSLLLPKKITLFGGKLFGYWSSFCLKIFYSTNIVIKGQENIINNEETGILPLIHPKYLLRSKEADRYTELNFFSGPKLFSIQWLYKKIQNVFQKFLRLFI